MAKALVLSALRTKFLGSNSLTSVQTLENSVQNFVLTSAWLTTNGAVRAVYGVIAVRIGAENAILLREGWIGEISDTTDIHGEGIAWYGELPLFDDRAVRLFFTVRNDSGAAIFYTGGYTWKEYELNDRPS